MKSIYEQKQDDDIDIDIDDEDKFVFSDEKHALQQFQNSSLIRSIILLASSFDNDTTASADSDTDEQQQQEKELILKRRLQKERQVVEEKAFIQGQKETVSLILDEIDSIQESYTAKGMREWKFTLGLMNCLLIAYVFGAMPQHFWILYIIETVYWMSSKFVGMWNAKPLCEIYYYLDFCWIMNLMGLCLFVAFVFFGQYVTPEHRRQLFLAAYGIAAGPVFMAAMALPFVSFLFHDVNTMANLVIHLMPTMLMYVMKYYPESMQRTYPQFFDLAYVDDMTQIPFYNSNNNTNDESKASVARNAAIAYFVWFVPYVIWMLCMGGMQLPSKTHCDTVFHSLWRGGPCELIGKLVWKRPTKISREQSLTNTFEARDFLLYMTGHAIACTMLGVRVLARICHSNQVGHFICLIIAVLICAKRGAERYTYYTTAMYGHRIRKHFNNIDRKATTTTTTKKQN